MDILKIFFVSIGSIIALFVLTKLMGNRQMSQLSMFDYINGITIGSIAAEMATSLDGEFYKPLLAMVIYAVAAMSISFATTKSIKLRRILTGKTLILYQDGKFYKGNLKKAKLDIDEFLTQCRTAGYFNLTSLQSAILETNGKISFLPVSELRPLSPKDMNISPPIEKPLINIILDGKLLKDNLKFTGNNEEWLRKALLTQGYKNYNDVFLASCDFYNNLTVYKKIDAIMTRDKFE